MAQENQIPMNPEIQAQLAGLQPSQAAPPQRNAIPSGDDFFARMALDEDFVEETPSAPPAPPANNVPSAVDLVDVDDLLSGGSIPGTPPPAAPPVAPQAPVPQAAPQPQVQQAPPQNNPSPPAAPPASPTPEQMQLQAIDYLRGNTYRFTDEQARQALTEPEVVLPELAARLHVNLIGEFAQQIHRVVPELVERGIQQRMASMEARNDFFRRYPKLNRPEWEGTIRESIQLAVQLNQGKNLTRDQLMAEGASLAAYRIRSTLPRPSAAPNRPQPYVPAQGSGSAPVVPQAPAQPTDIWAQFASDPDLFGGF